MNFVVGAAAGVTAVLGTVFYRKVSEEVWKPIRNYLISALDALFEEARKETPNIKRPWNDVRNAATETLGQSAGPILDGYALLVVDGLLEGFTHFANLCVGIVTWLVKDLKGTQYAELTLKYFTAAYAGHVTGEVVEKVMKKCGQSDTRALGAGFLASMGAGAAVGGLATGGVGALPGAVVGGVSYGAKKLFFR